MESALERRRMARFIKPVAFRARSIVWVIHVSVVLLAN